MLWYCSTLVVLSFLSCIHFICLIIFLLALTIKLVTSAYFYLKKKKTLFFIKHEQLYRAKAHFFLPRQGQGNVLCLSTVWRQKRAWAQYRRPTARVPLVALHDVALCFSDGPVIWRHGERDDAHGLREGASGRSSESQLQQPRPSRGVPAHSKNVVR